MAEKILLLARIKAAEDLLKEFEGMTDQLVDTAAVELEGLRKVVIDGQEVLVTLSEIMSQEEFVGAGVRFAEDIKNIITSNKKTYEKELSEG
jgi:hypothetical protein